MSLPAPAITPAPWLTQDQPATKGTVATLGITLPDGVFMELPVRATWTGYWWADERGREIDVRTYYWRSEAPQ